MNTSGIDGSSIPVPMDDRWRDGKNDFFFVLYFSRVASFCFFLCGQGTRSSADERIRGCGLVRSRRRGRWIRRSVSDFIGHICMEFRRKRIAGSRNARVVVIGTCRLRSAVFQQRKKQRKGTKKQTNKQTNRQTDRQAGRQTDETGEAKQTGDICIRFWLGNSFASESLPFPLRLQERQYSQKTSEKNSSKQTSEKRHQDVKTCPCY